MSDNGTGAGSDHTNLSASYQGNVVACAVATWVIAAIFVSLRFYLRGHLIKVLGREDWMILLALVFSAGISASFILEAHYGLGRHVAVLTDADIQRARETSWFANLWFAIAIYTTKVSILFLYMRVLTHNWVQKTLRVLMAMAILTCLTGLALILTACIPLNAYWDQNVHAAYCHSFQAYYAILSIQLGTDFLIFLLPLPVIWTMKAPRDQKLLLGTLFSFGFFICVVSIIRLTELAEIKEGTDWTYNSVAIDFWSMIEVNTGIVCASVTTMKPLFSQLVPGSSRKSGSTQDQMAAHSFHPPTIGSKPSRVNGVVKKQSWFTVQLARLDRSLQTVNENDAASDAAVGSRDLEAGSMRLPPLPSGPFLEVRPNTPRTSHQSSIMAPIEIDEGPLEPASYGRRPSGAGSFVSRLSAAGSFARRPSAAGSFGYTLSGTGSHARRPSCAG